LFDRFLQGKKALERLGSHPDDLLRNSCLQHFKVLVSFAQRLEGFVVPREVRQDVRRIFKGEVTGDQLVARYVAKAKKE
jgi:hypothetical protein